MLAKIGSRAFRGLSSKRSAVKNISSHRFAGVRHGHTAPVIPELFSHEPTILTTLPNGLRVASQRTPDELPTVGVFIDSGSRYETKETNGVAHFLEHMVFKGTQRRSRVQLEKEIEDMGASLNAYTAREQTVYFARSFKDDIPQTMDILSDILTKSTFDPDAIEEERHVILREMEEVEKSLDEVIFDRLHMCAFRDSSLGFTILGPPENIRSIKREWILDYIQKNYTADRMVISAVGDVDHKSLVALAEKHFGQYRAAPTPLVRTRQEKPHFCGSEIINRNDDIGPIVHCAAAYQAVPWTHPAQPVFMVMQSIIGAYDRNNEGLVDPKASGNRTINNCANKMNVGCVESFTAFNTCYKDTGLFGWYIQSNEKGMFHATDELTFAVANLAYSVTEEEVELAKHNLQTTLFGLDTAGALCEDIGRHILVYGRRIPPAEMWKRIAAVDVDEVRRVAWEHLYDVDMAVVAIGKTLGIFPLPNLRAKTSLNRW